MSNADLAAEALDVLFTVVRAALVWVLGGLILLTLTVLGLAALLGWLATLIRTSGAPVTFHYTDPDGDHLQIKPATSHDTPCISICTTEYTTGPGTSAAVYIPVDQVEELIAGIRDTARQAATHA